MRIIERATEMQEFDLERIDRLLSLKERYDALEAKKLFARAKVEFKKNPPTITKNKHVGYGTTSYDHATLDEVSSKIGNALALYGFTHEWKIAQSEARITVTCILTHVGGHSESVELSSLNDGSGGKNSIQAIASANTYLQRYTLLAVTGLSTSEIVDDDGRGTEPEPEAPQLHADVWVSLADAVHGGSDELAAAWKHLSNETRKIIVTHYSAKWNDLKAAAVSARPAIVFGQGLK
jgi:hypothetical protein